MEENVEFQKLIIILLKIKNTKNINLINHKTEISLLLEMNLIKINFNINISNNIIINSLNYEITNRGYLLIKAYGDYNNLSL